MLQIGYFTKCSHRPYDTMVHSCYAPFTYEKTEVLRILSNLKAMVSHSGSLTAENISYLVQHNNFAPEC